MLAPTLTSTRLSAKFTLVDRWILNPVSAGLLSLHFRWIWVEPVGVPARTGGGRPWPLPRNSLVTAHQPALGSHSMGPALPPGGGLWSHPPQTTAPLAFCLM